MTVAASLLNRTIPCWLASIGHAATGCTGAGEVYKSYKWLERDIEDSGEFICEVCDRADAEASYADYAAFCWQLDRSYPANTLEEWLAERGYGA